MSKYWFKPKTYGYGTDPITWQGWLATACLVILIFISLFVNVGYKKLSVVTPQDWLGFGLDVVILTTLFIIVFNEKTEGGIKWRWGKKT